LIIVAIKALIRRHRRSKQRKWQRIVLKTKWVITV
jgi:hypothetical protein